MKLNVCSPVYKVQNCVVPNYQYCFVAPPQYPSKIVSQNFKLFFCAENVFENCVWASMTFVSFHLYSLAKQYVAAGWI